VNKYLIAGDCYQVNLSLKWQVETEGDSWDFYKKFRSINQSPFMAYLAYDNFEILSGSPERFITCEGRNVITRPIKGTKPRGSSKDEDIKNKDILINSKKDQAENLMIVDLLRNDLGINCETGSISVEELFKLEIYENYISQHRNRIRILTRHRYNWWHSHSYTWWFLVGWGWSPPSVHR